MILPRYGMLLEFIRGTEVLGFRFLPVDIVDIILLSVYISALWKNEGQNHALMMLLAQMRTDDRLLR
jgi:hypothetical protein